MLTMNSHHSHLFPGYRNYQHVSQSHQANTSPRSGSDRKPSTYQRLPFCQGFRPYQRSLNPQVVCPEPTSSSPKESFYPNKRHQQQQQQQHGCLESFPRTYSNPTILPTIPELLSQKEFNEKHSTTQAPPILYSPTEAHNTSDESSGDERLSPSTSKHHAISNKQSKRKLVLTKKDIQDHLHLNQAAAAKKLGVSVSTLKRRFYEIFKEKRWPYHYTSSTSPTPEKASSSGDEDTSMNHPDGSRYTVTTTELSKIKKSNKTAKRKQNKVIFSPISSSTSTFPETIIHQSNDKDTSKTLLVHILNEKDSQNEKFIDKETLIMLNSVFAAIRKY